MGGAVVVEISLVDSFGVRGRTVAIFRGVPWRVARSPPLFPVYKKEEYRPQF
jgi:hypothetical protein